MSVRNCRGDHTGPSGLHAEKLRAFVEKRNHLFRGERWRYVIEELWVSWDTGVKSSWRFRSRAEAEQAAKVFMEEWCNADERKTYVSD